MSLAGMLLGMITGIGIYWLGLELWFRLWDKRETQALLKRLDALDDAYLRQQQGGTKP